MTCPLCNGNRLWWRWIRRHFNCLDCGASFPKFATLFASNATFEAALDNPPEPNETLKDLMAGDVRESLAVRIDARLTPDRVTPLVEALRKIRQIALDDHWGTPKVDCQIINEIDAALAQIKGQNP